MKKERKPIIYTTLLVGEDGFGGKWNFDIRKIKSDIKNFARVAGQKNFMVKRSSRCWQVKHRDVEVMRTFCASLNMSNKAIIEFDKPNGKVYVVNLYHPKILEVVGYDLVIRRVD